MAFYNVFRFVTLIALWVAAIVFAPVAMANIAIFVGGSLSFMGGMAIYGVYSAWAMIVFVGSGLIYNSAKILRKLRAFIVNWYLTRKIRQLLEDREVLKKAGYTTLGLIGVASVVAGSIHLRNRARNKKKESKERSPFAVRVMTTMQSLLGMGFMAAQFFGDNQTIKEMREVVNNSMLMTKIVYYFEKLRSELGIVTVEVEDEIQVGEKKFKANSKVVKPFSDLTKQNDQWIWVKYVSEAKSLDDTTCVLWMTQNKTLLQTCSEEVKKFASEWITMEEKKNKKPSFLDRWTKSGKKTEEDVRPPESVSPLVNELECMIKDKEAVFAPIVRGRLGGAVLNGLIMGIPALSFGIVKFCWINRGFSPVRIISMSLICFVVFVLTILEPQYTTSDQLNDLGDEEMVTLKEARSRRNTKNSGKRWRTAAGGGGATRKYKRMRLPDAEYKALSDLAKKAGMNIGSLIRAKVDDTLGYNEDDDQYAYDSWRDAYNDDFRLSKYDPDDFYAHLAKYDDDEDDYEGEALYTQTQMDDLRKELNSHIQDLRLQMNTQKEFFLNLFHKTDQVQSQADKNLAKMRAKVDTVIELRQYVDQLRAQDKGISIDDELAAIKMELSQLRDRRGKDPEFTSLLDEATAKILALKDETEAVRKEVKVLQDNGMQVKIFGEPSTPAKVPEKKSTVSGQNDKAAPYLCTVCSYASSTVSKARKHAKVHDKKERVIASQPAFDAVALRKSYIEIQVLDDGEWKHQGGAVATTEGGGKYAFSVYHNIQGFDIKNMKARIPDPVDAEKTLAEWSIKPIKYDDQKAWDCLIFEIPSTISSEKLVRLPVSDVPKMGHWTQGVSVRVENNKLAWREWPGNMLYTNTETGILEMNNSTISGDSGSPVFVWDEKTQKWVLVAVHMQAGVHNKSNTARLIHQIEQHLFRAN